MTEQQKNKLKKVTKKEVNEVQKFLKNRTATMSNTSWILGLGIVNYFYHPTVCGSFVAGYLTLLHLDMLKTVATAKFGIDPLWNWQMKDLGFLVVYLFGFVTAGILCKAALVRLKQRGISKAITVRRAPSPPSKP